MCCYPDAAAAADNCYDTFNTAGRFNGHCGLNGTSGGYLRCDAEYAVLFVYLITIFFASETTRVLPKLRAQLLY